MRLDISSSDLDKVINDLNLLPEQVAKCTRYALDRTVEFVHGHLAKELSAEKRVKLKIIRDRLKIIRGNLRDNFRVINANFSGILVRDLGTPRQTAHGVSINGTIYNPHSFVASLKKGAKPGVYVRKTKDRFPVRSVRIPIYEDALRLLNDVVGPEATEVFKKRFEHELRRIWGYA